MSTTRRPEDVTDEEVRRTYEALASVWVLHGLSGNHIRAAIASGLLVPPPRERTQMERDEEEWRRRLDTTSPWTQEDARTFNLILDRLFDAAKAAGVTY